MSTRKNSATTSYDNSAFDKESVNVQNTNGTSPMGSTIFIIKSKDENQQSESYQYDPITKKNIGHVIVRSIRGKAFFILICFFKTDIYI